MLREQKNFVKAIDLNVIFRLFKSSGMTPKTVWEIVGKRNGGAN